jgi:hypothetical protein
VPEGRPNIMVIWGDDIGMWNLSAYNRGAMGYRTPNIDRIAKTYIVVAMVGMVVEHLETLQRCPPSQRGRTLSIAAMIDTVMKAIPRDR